MNNSRSNHSPTQEFFQRRVARIELCNGPTAVDFFFAAGLDIICDLRFSDWSGLDFSRCDLTGCDFTGASLTGCNFYEAKIAGAIFDDEAISSGVLSDASDFRTYQKPKSLLAFLPSIFMRIKDRHYADRYIEKYGPERIFASTDQVNAYIRCFDGEFDAAFSKLALFDELRLRPNSETFDWLGHAAEYSRLNQPKALTIERVIEAAKNWQVRPSEKLYSRAISAASSYEKSRQLLKEMERNGVKPTQEAYACLIQRAPDFETAFKDFRELCYYRKLKPNERVFCSMIRASGDFSRAHANFREIEKRGLERSIESYNALLSKVVGPQRSPREDTLPLFQGKEIASLARSNGLRLNQETYQELIRLCGAFNDVTDLLREMKATQIWPGAEAMTIAAGKVWNFKDATTLRSLLSGYRHLPTTFFAEIFSNLIRRRADADELLDWAYSHKGDNDRPHEGAWDVAIDRYTKQRPKPRIAQALRIASAFPHLRASKALFLDFEEDSKFYLEERYKVELAKGESGEPHHPANALGQLYEYHGRIQESIDWYLASIDTGKNRSARAKKIGEKIERLSKQLKIKS